MLLYHESLVNISWMLLIQRMYVLSILELLNLFKKRKEKKHDFILRQTNNNKSRQFLNSYIKLFNQVISYRLPLQRSESSDVCSLNGHVPPFTIARLINDTCKYACMFLIITNKLCNLPRWVVHYLSALRPRSVHVHKVIVVMRSGGVKEAENLSFGEGEGEKLRPVHRFSNFLLLFFSLSLSQHILSRDVTLCQIEQLESE